MEKTGDQLLTGNDRYDGFCVDMLQEIADIVGFKYRIELVADGKYGAPDKNYVWNGMVREVLDKVRLAAVGPAELFCVDMDSEEKLYGSKLRRTTLVFGSMPYDGQRGVSRERNWLAARSTVVDNYIGKDTVTKVPNRRTAIFNFINTIWTKAFSLFYDIHVVYMFFTSHKSSIFFIYASD